MFICIKNVNNSHHAEGVLDGEKRDKCVLRLLDRFGVPKNKSDQSEMRITST